MKERILWIDYAKVLLIFCVCLVHTHCNEPLTTVLKAFIIPSFFFISGFLFRMRTDVTVGRFCMKRFRQLMVPYLWINAVAYVCWLVALRHFGPDAAVPTPWHEPLSAVVLGLPSGLIHDIPTWFLVCLFCTEVIYCVVSRVMRSDVVICAVFLAAAFGAGLLPVELPFALGPATAGTAFYALGHYCRGRIPVLSVTGRMSFSPLMPLAAVAGGAVFVVAALSNSRVGFFVNDYGNVFLFLVAAIAGIFTVISAGMSLSAVAGSSRVVLAVAESTLIICGFHLLMFAAIKGLFYFGFHYADYNALQSGSVMAGCLISVAAMAMCVPLARLVRRFLPSLLS